MNLMLERHSLQWKVISYLYMEYSQCVIIMILRYFDFRLLLILLLWRHTIYWAKFFIAHLKAWIRYNIFHTKFIHLSYSVYKICYQQLKKSKKTSPNRQYDNVPVYGKWNLVKFWYVVAGMVRMPNISRNIVKIFFFNFKTEYMPRLYVFHDKTGISIQHMHYNWSLISYNDSTTPHSYPWIIYLYALKSFIFK